MGTLCPRSTSHHKWLGVLFISYPPGILTCEKQTLYRGFLLSFYYFRKEAGSRTALSHHFKFLLFLLAFDLVLGMIVFSNETKFGHHFSPPNLHLSASVNRKGWGLISARSWYTSFQAQKCTSSLNSTLSPEKCQTRKKKISCLCSLICLQLLAKQFLPRCPTGKTITPRKKSRVPIYFWCVGSSLILYLTAHSPPIFAELADLIHNDALLDLVQWHSRSAQVWVSSPHCCQIQNTLCKCQHHV